MTTERGGGGGLAGRVAVVTGGSAGIGAATVRALVADGAAVGFSARNVEAVAALESELSATGVHHLVFEATVRVLTPSLSASAIEQVPRPSC